MEGSQCHQDRSRYRAFVDKVSGAAQGSAGDMEIHQRSSGSQDAGGRFMNGRRSVPSEFAMLDTSILGSNQHCQGFSHRGSLYDEQSLVSAFEDMVLRTGAADSSTDCRNAALVNGQYLSGCGDVAMNQPRVSVTHQDEYIPLKFGFSGTNEKTEEVAFEDQQQAFNFPPHLGNSPRSSRQLNCDSIFSIPYHQSTDSASPFQQHCYLDGPSPMHTPYDEPFGSNFILRHDMGVQPYSVMQSHYAYPQMQQFSGLDVPRNRRISPQASACGPANGASSCLRIPNFHGLEGWKVYNLNGPTFQKSNGPLNSAFAARFPRTSYIDGSCGNGGFHLFQQQEKVACTYRPGFPQHGITANNSMSYPERIQMGLDSVNPVGSIKFAPSANGCTDDMDQRINGFQSNDSLNQWLKPQILSSKSISKLAMASPQLTYDSLDGVVGRIRTVAKDKNGCRFLQKVFSEGTPEDAENIFAEIIDGIGELMMDPFAHYLIQKILEECSNDQRMRIIYEITNVPVDLIEVSCNMHGTRVVQKVIETINSPEQALKIVSALKPGTVRLMTDLNGSHVIHRCLQRFLPQHKAFFLDAAVSWHLQLARDRHGCCILQKCIEHSNGDQKNNLLNNITSVALSLSEDQYGNYVIQFILSLKIEWATSKIVGELVGHFGNLSMQKCGSHVVEQCLKQATPAVRNRIINELINDPKLPHVMLDQYGNYVIQTALKESKGDQHTAFVEAIRPHGATLQSNIFGKWVLSRKYMKNKHCRYDIF